ncbi:hypothetical protein [Nocardia shimofusensis]|uniref:hypothetical protein n=1 Tax=Nocardia shimofusensis TaxID=228596 RepID=UPI00082AE244|nr:hypothetical protein [Nocardia shimofusensis]
MTGPAAGIHRRVRRFVHDPGVSPCPGITRGIGARSARWPGSPGILTALAEVLVEVTIILPATAGTGAVAATARAMFGITSASLKVSTGSADLAKAVFDLKALATAAAQAVATIAKIEQIAWIA